MRSRGGVGRELLHRRYSVPEVVMRKYSLSRQQTSSAGSMTTGDSGSGGGAGGRSRWRQPRRQRTMLHNKSSQTSPAPAPQLTSQHIEPSSSAPSSTTTRRSKSYPEELSARPAKVYRSFRPISADEKLFSFYSSGGSSGDTGVEETPSPRTSGCERCAPWTATSASTTLSQTVTEKTTSTQDSTLSVPSTTPESYPLTPASRLDFRPDPGIFSPVLGTAVIESETSLVYPVEVVDSGRNYRFGQSGSSEGARSVDSERGTPTKEDSDSSARREETESTRTAVARPELSLSRGVTPDVLSVASCAYEGPSTDVATNTEIVFGERVSPVDGRPCAVACQTSPSTAFDPERRGPDDKDGRFGWGDAHSTLRERREALEREFFGYAENDDVFCGVAGRNEFEFVGRENVYAEYTERYPIDYVKTDRGLAEVSGTSGNYKEFPGSEMIIPRYSAMPRSGSMLVNTSSVDYTSDSDLSLTDSLEDPGEHAGRVYWPSSKHDNRLVRGEVNTHEEINTRKKYIKSKNTYAYFLFLSGEEDMIKEYTLPEKLKTRLRQKEEEIKKHFEMKFSEAKKPSYRKRKKLKFVRRNSEGNSSNTQDKKKQCAKGTNKSTQCNNKSQSSGDHKHSPVNRAKANKKYNANKTTLKHIKEKENKGESDIDKDIAKILMGSIDSVEKKTEEYAEPEATKCSDEKDIRIINFESPNSGELTEGNAADVIVSTGTQTEAAHELAERTDPAVDAEKNDCETFILCTSDRPNESTKDEVAKQTIETTLKEDNRGEMASIEDRKDETTSTEDRKDETTSTEDRKDKMTWKEDNRGEMASIEDRKDETTSTEDRKDEMTSTEDHKDKKTSTEDHKGESSTEDHKGETTSTEDRKDKMTSTEDRKDKMTSTEDHKGETTSTKGHKDETTSTEGHKDETTSTEYHKGESSTEDHIGETTLTEDRKDKMTSTEDHKGETTSTEDHKDETIVDCDDPPEQNGVEQTEECTYPATYYASTSVQTSNSVSEDKATSANAEGGDDSLSKGIQVFGPLERKEMNSNGSSCCSSPPAIVPEIIIEDVPISPTDSWDGFSDAGDEDNNAVRENDKNAINSPVRTALYLTPTKELRRQTSDGCGKPSKGYRPKAEILEINTASCTCHMCTFQKMSTSPTGHKESSGKSTSGSTPQKTTPAGGRSTPTNSAYAFRQERKIPKASIGRRNVISTGRFTQKFEVIPEEKNSSLESPTEEQSGPLDLSPQWKKSTVDFPQVIIASPVTEVELGRKTEPEGIRRISLKIPRDSPAIERNVCDIVSRGLTKAPEKRENESASDMTEEELDAIDSAKKMRNSKINTTGRNQTKPSQSYKSNKRPSVVIGRFKAVQEDNSESNGCLLGESLNIVGQYKGRAALASTQLEQEDQEELLTLSKGWINFYLLRDSQDVLSDHSNSEDILQKSEDKIRKNLKGRPVNDQNEDVVQQYTLEIQATPEPNMTNYNQNKEICLPNLKTKGNKIQQRPIVNERPELILPEITSSSSSSTPESMLQHTISPPPKFYASSNSKLPELKKEKKNGLKGTTNMKKQKRERHSPSPENSTNSHSFLNIPQAIESTSRAVDVVCSEQSVSSVTSSTVILSDSPPPEKIKLPERKIQRHRTQNISSTSTTKQTTCINNSGNSWTVTVAGSSSNADQPPPDVEMRLMFGRNDKQSKREKSDGKNHGKELVHYSGHHTTRNVTSRPSRQQECNLEDQVDLRNDHRTLHCLPEASFVPSQVGKRDKGHRTKTENPKENPLRTASVDDCNHHSQSRGACRICSREQRDSGSENTVTSICSDLQVTGMSITPEQKPRVPTQSERDLVRSHRYKFT